MSRAVESVGPDPVWGVGIFLIGLLVMAIGGAGTWHWMFNIGETVLLIGVIVFATCMAITSHRQEHLMTRIRRALGNNAEPDDDATPDTTEA